MDYRPTIADEIISHLLCGKSMYRQKKILWERVRNRKKLSKQSFNQNIYRLSKRGYIESKNDGYVLSALGKRIYKNPHSFIYVKPKKDKKVLVIFDVPENKRKTRRWLRDQLKWWNFKMVQKSVWLGDGPLPVDFKKRLKDLGIDKSVLIFAIKSEKLN